MQNEKETEENKPIGEKNWENVNVNDLLLKRREFFKFVGDSSEFVQNKLCPPLEITMCAYPESPIKIKDQIVYIYAEKPDTFSEWAKDIGEYKKNLILGCLWEACWRRDEAIKYFKEAEKSGEGEQIAKAKQMLGRVYDRQYGKLKAREAIKYYENAFEMFKDFDADQEAAHVKIDLANFKRRVLQQFSEAKILAEEAKLLLEPIKDNDKEHELAYARCLNVLGLIHFGLKIKNNLAMAHILCKESKDIKKKHGDVDGVSESENAIGLICREEGRGDVDLIKESIKYFKTAFVCREKIGNYRGCGQHLRNLGLCYTDLIDLVPDKKEENFQLAKECYENGITNWYMIKPGEPPTEELLEFRFRLGELQVKYGDKNEAINHLQLVGQKRHELGDWHNLARCLSLLCEVYIHKGDDDRMLSICDHIISIYQEVLSDENKLKEMKDAKIKFKNAKEILEKSMDAAALTSARGDYIVEEGAKIIEELKRKIG